MTDESQDAVVTLNVVGHIAYITLSRSKARNALNYTMCIQLREAFITVDLDPDVRVVLLRACGSVFCAGADLKERQGKDALWVKKRRMVSFSAYEAIEKCHKPVVAILQGPAIGSGGEIAMSSDFIIASVNTSFRFPEPQWGTVGATQRLQRIIGQGRAKEMLFTGRTMSAKEALALGLVARVVEPEELDETASSLACQIAEAPALAMELTKQAINNGGNTDLASGIRIEMAAIEHSLSGEDWRDGIKSFAQDVGTREPKE